MLETILTRLVLHYAQRYINNLKTEQLSFWGGDLLLNDLELNVEALAEQLVLPKGLKLVRGYFKKLRIRVPWSALRSKSIEVNFETVEIIVGRTDENEDDKKSEVESPMPSPDRSAKKSRKATPSRMLNTPEQQQSWAKPLLQTIGANIVVNFSNLVVKLQQGPLTCAAMFSKIELTPATRSESGEWTKGFAGIVQPHQSVKRFQSFSDLTITLQIHKKEPVEGVQDVTASIKKKNRRKRCLPLEKPLLHRASFVVYLALPPTRKVLDETPPLKADIHVAPLSFYCTEHHVKVLLALLAGPESDVIKRRDFLDNGSVSEFSDFLSESGTSAARVGSARVLRSENEEAPSLVAGSNRLITSTIDEIDESGQREPDEEFSPSTPTKKSEEKTSDLPSTPQVENVDTTSPDKSVGWLTSARNYISGSSREATSKEATSSTPSKESTPNPQDDDTLPVPMPADGGMPVLPDLDGLTDEEKELFRTFFQTDSRQQELLRATQPDTAQAELLKQHASAKKPTSLMDAVFGASSPEQSPEKDNLTESSFDSPGLAATTPTLEPQPKRAMFLSVFIPKVHLELFHVGPKTHSKSALENATSICHLQLDMLSGLYCCPLDASVEGTLELARLKLSAGGYSSLQKMPDEQEDESQKNDKVDLFRLGPEEDEFTEENKLFCEKSTTDACLNFLNQTGVRCLHTGTCMLDPWRSRHPSPEQKPAVPGSPNAKDASDKKDSPSKKEEVPPLPKQTSSGLSGMERSSVTKVGLLVVPNDFHNVGKDPVYRFSVHLPQVSSTVPMKFFSSVRKFVDGIYTPSKNMNINCNSPRMSSLKSLPNISPGGSGNGYSPDRGPAPDLVKGPADGESSVGDYFPSPVPTPTNRDSTNLLNTRGTSKRSMPSSVRSRMPLATPPVNPTPAKKLNDQQQETDDSSCAYEISILLEDFESVWQCHDDKWVALNLTNLRAGSVCLPAEVQATLPQLIQETVVFQPIRFVLDSVTLQNPVNFLQVPTVSLNIWSSPNFLASDGSTKPVVKLTNCNVYYQPGANENPFKASLGSETIALQPDVNHLEVKCGQTNVSVGLKEVAAILLLTTIWQNQHLIIEKDTSSISASSKEHTSNANLQSVDVEINSAPPQDDLQESSHSESAFSDYEKYVSILEGRDSSKLELMSQDIHFVSRSLSYFPEKSVEKFPATPEPKKKKIPTLVSETSMNSLYDKDDESYSTKQLKLLRGTPVKKEVQIVQQNVVDEEIVPLVVINQMYCMVDKVLVLFVVDEKYDKRHLLFGQYDMSMLPTDYFQSGHHKEKNRVQTNAMSPVKALATIFTQSHRFNTNISEQQQNFNLEYPGIQVVEDAPPIRKLMLDKSDTLHSSKLVPRILARIEPYQARVFPQWIRCLYDLQDIAYGKEGVQPSPSQNNLEEKKEESGSYMNAHCNIDVLPSIIAFGTHCEDIQFQLTLPWVVANKSSFTVANLKLERVFGDCRELTFCPELNSKSVLVPLGSLAISCMRSSRQAADASERRGSLDSTASEDVSTDARVVLQVKRATASLVVSGGSSGSKEVGPKPKDANVPTYGWRIRLGNVHVKIAPQDLCWKSYFSYELYASKEASSATINQYDNFDAPPAQEKTNESDLNFGPKPATVRPTPQQVQRKCWVHMSCSLDVQMLVPNGLSYEVFFSASGSKMKQKVVFRLHIPQVSYGMKWVDSSSIGSNQMKGDVRMSKPFFSLQERKNVEEAANLISFCEEKVPGSDAFVSTNLDEEHVAHWIAITFKRTLPTDLLSINIISLPIGIYLPVPNLLALSSGFTTSEFDFPPVEEKVSPPVPRTTKVSAELGVISLQCLTSSIIPPVNSDPIIGICLSDISFATNDLSATVSFSVITEHVASIERQHSMEIQPFQGDLEGGDFLQPCKVKYHFGDTTKLSFGDVKVDLFSYSSYGKLLQFFTSCVKTMYEQDSVPVSPSIRTETSMGVSKKGSFDTIRNETTRQTVKSVNHQKYKFVLELDSIQIQLPGRRVRQGESTSRTSSSKIDIQKLILTNETQGSLSRLMADVDYWQVFLSDGSNFIESSSSTSFISTTRTDVNGCMSTEHAVSVDGDIFAGLRFASLFDDIGAIFSCEYELLQEALQQSSENNQEDICEQQSTTKIKIMLGSLCIDVPIIKDPNRKIKLELAEFNLYMWPAEMISLVTNNKDRNLSNGFVFDETGYTGYNLIADKKHKVCLTNWSKSVIDIAVDSFGATLYQAGNLESTLLAPSTASIKIHSIGLVNDHISTGIRSIDAFLSDVHMFVGVAQLRTLLDAFTFSYEENEAPTEVEPSTSVRIILNDKKTNSKKC